jgi:hypothetical protein
MLGLYKVDIIKKKGLNIDSLYRQNKN